MTKARDIASAAPAPSTVSATEIGYLDGVTSAIQTQIDSKIGSASAINPTIVDAKGDLLVGSAADTVARLAVGTNDYVLTADSAATNGVKWAALPASGPTFVGCIIRLDSNQSIDNNTNTILTFNGTDVVDTDGFHDSSSNASRITIPTGKGGNYLINFTGTFAANTTGRRMFRLYRNGSTARFGVHFIGSAGDTSDGIHHQTFSGIRNLTAGDYLEVQVYQNSGSNQNIFSDDTRFSVQYLGA